MTEINFEAANIGMPHSALAVVTRPKQPPRRATEEELAILKALSILRARFKTRDVFRAPDAVKDYLRLQAQGLTHEVFSVRHLDAQNHLIDGGEGLAVAW